MTVSVSSKESLFGAIRLSLIHVSCALHYEVTTPTSFLLNGAVAQTAHQTVRQESFTVTPPSEDAGAQVGREGNRVARLQAKPDTLRLSYQALVELQPQLADPPALREAEPRELPSEVLPYLNPSRYGESDRLLRWARKEFGHVAPGYARVVTLCDWIQGYLDYEAGSTDACTSACAVLVQRTGGCRDYAHLAIALCRALGIPARYVSGYAVGLTPPDFHGFFEASLGSRWSLFDATRMAPRDGWVRIGTGRDAAEASFATLMGAATLQRMTVAAKALTEEREEEPGSATSAIATA